MTLQKYFINAQAYLLGGLISILPFANAYAASNGLIAYPARDTSGNQNIFFVASDGTGKVQKTFGADNGLPIWSPDGVKLAYERKDRAAGRSYICIMNADGSGQHEVAEGATPVWSPDGTLIAFITTANDANAPGCVGRVGVPDGRQVAYAQYTQIEVVPVPGRQLMWICTR